MKIHALPALKDNFIYVLENGTDALVVDPGESAPVIEFLEQNPLRLTHVLCTHHHPDHIAGAPDLKAKFGTEVWCSERDLPRIAGATRSVREGESLNLLGEKLEVLFVPGHTQGQIAYWWPERLALFPGDTLFSCGCGRLFEGTAEQMFKSMQKLKKLPAEAEIYFGHEYTLRNIDFVLAQKSTPALVQYKAECVHRLNSGEPTTPARLERELTVNPFLMAQSVEDFARWRELRNSW